MPRRGGTVGAQPALPGLVADRPDGFPDQVALRYQRPQAQIAAVDTRRGGRGAAELDIRGDHVAQDPVRRARCTPTLRPASRTCSSTSAPRRSTTCASGAR